MAKHILTLQFDIEVETGVRDIKDIERMVVSSYSEYCGEKVKLVSSKVKE